jgi:DNA-binding response OmpR family regulator
MNNRVLIVEDDKSIARLLRDNLEYEGFSVEWAATGQEALDKAQKHSPDLVLLDLMLPPGVDSYELCRTFSDVQGKAVIIITARGQKDERIRGLRLGADDYIVKPFALDELLARIHAVLRRTAPPPDVLRLGDAEIDFRRLRAKKGGEDLAHGGGYRLTPGG